MKLLLILIFFNIHLQEIRIDEFDNTVVVVIDELYCKSCLDSIVANQQIWNSDFSTTILQRAKKTKVSTIYYAKYYHKKLKYDSIYFFDDTEEYILDKTIIFKTPYLVFIKNNRKRIMNYEELFSEQNKKNINHIIKTVIEEINSK